jgi:hypothetical protein
LLRRIRACEPLRLVRLRATFSCLGADLSVPCAIATILIKEDELVRPLRLQAIVPETLRYLWSYPELIALSFFAEDATIHEVLYAMLQGFGQRSDHQR